LARESGFLVRKSKFTIGSFLDVLYDSFTDTSPTLTDYAIIFKKNNGNSISKQAIDQRVSLRLRSCHLYKKGGLAWWQKLLHSLAVHKKAH
jgi:hypothetical protein